MPEARYHLVQLHRPDDGWAELQALAAQARRAAEHVNSEDTPVRFLRSIFVPGDGTCFHLFEGTADAVAEASAWTGIAADGIVPAVDIRVGDGSPPQGAPGGERREALA